jgi:Flp pilus assembly protein TadB
MPFVAAIGLSLLQPTYMQPMWQTTTGRELVVGALVSMALGTFILKRIVSIGS